MTDWKVTPGRLRGRETIDCGLAGTVMRFVPPVAALADGPVVFDGDPHARLRPMHEILQGLRGLGVVVEDEDRGALPFTVVGTGSVRGGQVTIDASASSQFVSALLLAGARYDEGVDVRHDGKPVPSLPHIDMTVEQLRLRGVDVDDSDVEPLAGPAVGDPRGRRTGGAGPVQRRAVPRRGPGHRRQRDACRTGRGPPPRPATRCARSSR